MRILAIDPSTKSLGWALLDGERVLEHGAVDIRAKGLPARVARQVERRIPHRAGLISFAAEHLATELIFKLQPDLVAVEEGFPRGQSTRILITVRDSIYRASHDAGVPAVAMALTTWRAATFPAENKKHPGDERGDKAARLKLAAVAMATVIAGHPIDTDDEAEAICLGVYVSRTIPRQEALAA